MEQASDLEVGANIAGSSHFQIVLIRLIIARVRSIHRGSYLKYKNEAKKDGIEGM